MIVVFDSIPLEESDTGGIGGYSAFFARATTGELFVNDQTQRRIFRFDRGGRTSGRIGGPGSGPGEFDVPGVVQVLPGDSLLAVVDISRRALQLFALPSGRYLRQVTLPAQDVGGNWEVQGGMVRFALHMSPAVVGSWRMTDDSAHGSGATPTALMQAPFAEMAHGRSDLVTTDSGPALLLPTEPGLLLLDAHDAVRGLVRIPVARRRGEPADLFERMAKMGRDPGGFIPFASSADGVHRLSDGAILVAHLDMDRASGTAMSRGYGGFRLYLSVIAPDLASACVDGEVTIPTDVPPVPRFSGDTVYFLARVTGADDEVRSVLYALRVDRAGCEWVPTGGVVPLRGPDGG
jgi:hypothetical protein